MNKTVNINLAGTFFHIDEDAYLKLQRYLEAIKRSFTDAQGRSEIIADIEARIAELFNERVQNDKQVIRIKEVDEVISIMGQPEDYLVDDEIFEDEPQPAYKRKSAPSKKLFRDTRECLEKERKIEIDAIEKQKDTHTKQLLKNHEKSFNDIKNYPLFIF